MFKAFSLVWCILMLHCILPGQNVLTLDEAIKIGLENNYAIKLAQNASMINTSNNTMGNAGMLPVVALNFGQTFNINNTKQEFFSGDKREGNNVNTNVGNANIQANWTVFNGMQMFINKDRLDALQNIGMLQLQFQIETITAQIMAQYFDIEQQEKRIDIIKEAINISKDRIQLAKVRESLGSGSGLAIIQAEVDINADSSLLIQQQLVLKNMKVGLNELLVRSPDTDFKTQPSPDFKPLSLEELLSSTMTRNKLLEIAEKKSLDAFKAKQQYGASYWQYRSFKASVLPKINLNLEPLTYNKSVTKRYDSGNNIDVFRPQQNLHSYGNISINQNIQATGATMYVNSSFDRLANFGALEGKNFTTTPIRIGFDQPIMAFNAFKWAHKIAPLQFEQAKKQYLYELQDIKLKSVTYFFNWAIASKNVQLAQENVLTTQKLLKIGKKRYDLGSIEKDDLLNLELDTYNAETSVAQNQRELAKAEAELKLFLRDDSPLNATPQLPELILNLQIDSKQAHALALTNNPNLFNLNIKRTQAQRDLDKAIKDNRFNLSVTGSYGLNQNATSLQESYSNLLEQQMIAVKLSMPILDWGQRRGNIKTAKMNSEITEIAVQQEGDKINQELLLKVIDFNLQKQMVTVALRNSEISKASYEITEKRFLNGSIDLLRLSSARKSWQTAAENYITSLYKYWRLYYKVQQLTLYDFESKSSITKNFDEILEK